MKLKCAVLLLLVLCLSGCGSAAATYTHYVQAVMDCTYYAQTEEYIRLTGVTEAEALALHENQVQRTAELICVRMTVKPEEISEATMEGYYSLAETLLSKVQYSIEPAVKSGNAYQVSVISQPLDFWEISLPDVEWLYSTRFAERFARAEDNTKRLSQLEKEWGKEVLRILNEYAEQTSGKEDVSTILPVLPDTNGRYTVSDANWLYLDHLLLDIQ